MSEKKEKDKISGGHLEELSKKGIDRFVPTGEIAKLCNQEELRRKMQTAKSNGGIVFLYKAKKEIKAICIFDLEERELPLKAAVIETKEIISGVFCDNKERTAEVELEEAETVLKKCYICRTFLAVPSCEDKKEEIKKKITDTLKRYMVEREIPAYIWEDEIVMTNQVVSGGNFISVWSLGWSVGMVLGVAFGIISDADNLGLCMLWGMVIGGMLTMGGTTIIKKTSV